MYLKTLLRERLKISILPENQRKFKFYFCAISQILADRISDWPWSWVRAAMSRIRQKDCGRSGPRNIAGHSPGSKDSGRWTARADAHLEQVCFVWTLDEYIFVKSHLFVNFIDFINFLFCFWHIVFKRF